METTKRPPTLGQLARKLGVTIQIEMDQTDSEKIASVAICDGFRQIRRFRSGWQAYRLLLAKSTRGSAR